jgi:hypothetical protein
MDYLNNNIGCRESINDYSGTNLAIDLLVLNFTQERILELEREFLGWIDWSSVTSLDSCWRYTRSIGKQGYGLFQINYNVGQYVERFRIISSRFAYWLYYDKLQSWHNKYDTICHTCDNPACVNPSHLYHGTDATNAIDKAKRGRTGVAKLTEDQVREIRKLAEENKHTQRELSRMFNVGQDQISRIINFKRPVYVS